MSRRKVDVIVDLQFGSTGKGAVAAYMVGRRVYDASMRVQSVQAGHTIYYHGKPYKMRTIPCAWVNPNVELVLGPGAFIDKDLLLEEIKMITEATGIDPRPRLFVDYRATYLIPEDYLDEKSAGIEGKVGSTAHGAGASLIRKLWRVQPPTRVCDDQWANEHGIDIVDTIKLYRDAYLLVEGCQGTMLSIHTSPYYPYVTTRESTACGILSECGIAPREVNDVLGVFRSLPIRVGGNSGPTGGRELSWTEVNAMAGREVEPERTTVTNRVRRIFEFSHNDFEQALSVNGPTMLFMTFADYLAPGIYGASKWSDLPYESAEILRKFSLEIYKRHGQMIDWFGTGEQADHYITA